MEQTESRIYGERVPIEDAKSFWNQRAQKYDPANPYKVTKLNDSNLEYQKISDAYEKETVLQKLGIHSESRVLDIGCGIGRLSDTIIPACKEYVGVDYAQDLIEIAKERLGAGGRIQFFTSSFQELGASPVSELGKFDCILVAGVCMYINDNELKRCFEQLLPMAAPKCVLYFADTTAFEKRLTLRDFYSQELNTTYNAIYRTKAEYQEMFRFFEEHGFQLDDTGYFPKASQQYQETLRHYFIYQRGLHGNRKADN